MGNGEWGTGTGNGESKGYVNGNKEGIDWEGEGGEAKGIED